MEGDHYQPKKSWRDSNWKWFVPTKYFYFLLCLALFQSQFSFAQSAHSYQNYANTIVQFSKPARVLTKNIDAQGNGTIEFTNARKQVLRFQLYQNKIKSGLCRIAFEIYYYENNYLRKIESLDANGKLIGCNLKLNNEAVTVYTIERPDLYLKKKKLIDDAEGNIDMKDDSNEKIIRVRLFDQNNIQIKETKPAYISSKTYWDQNVRMSWP